MNSKKTFLTVTALTAVLTASLVVAGPHGRGCDRDGLPPVFSSLNLSAEQQTQVRDILKTQWAKHRDQMRAQREVNRAETKSELGKVLTGEQLAQFDEWIAARQEQRSGRGWMGHGRGHHRWDRDDDDRYERDDD